MSALSHYAVVVPSLHPVREHLIPFLREILRLEPGAVIVVDDGSGHEYQATFTDAEAMGCLVLRHGRNFGKGRALKTGFRHCAEHLPHLSGIVTADSDGQHAPADLLRVVERQQQFAERGLLTTVFGSRAFAGRDVPAKSKVGNVLTTLIVQVLFGRRITDTQSGLRCFPLAMARDLIGVRGERFDYEMNQLLWLLATNRTVDELDIHTIYHDTANSISHFRPVRDSLRIYAIILRQFVVFSGVSALSAVFDMLLYFIIIDFVFGPGRTPADVAVAVAVARMGSSILNFALNRSVVFGASGSRSRAATRYAALAAVIMLLSAAGTATLSVVTNGHDMWAKVVSDATLFLLSYVVQRRWVFVHKGNAGTVDLEYQAEGEPTWR